VVFGLQATLTEAGTANDSHIVSHHTFSI